jgi:ribosomal protein S18 acetylase RimI-like enzyme
VRIEEVNTSSRQQAMEFLESCRPGMVAILGPLLAQPGRCIFLWADGEGGPVAAAVAVSNPGRTAMIFLCHVGLSQAGPAAVVGLLEELTRRAFQRGAQLVQAMLSPAGHPDAGLLEQAGYRRLAELIYLRRGLAVPWQAGQTSLEFRPYGGQDAALAEIIRRTYEDSQDCPGLLGWRAMEDVLASHKASGLFRPGCWWIPHLDGQPVGCVLVNDLTWPAGACEVVYLGVCREFRRRGLARQMLRHAMAQARQRGRGEMLLAVDAGNSPAVGLYRQEGFREDDRRVVYIKSP